MNIKRILILAIVVVLCMCASAMAATYNLSDYTPNSDGWVLIGTVSADEYWRSDIVVQSGDVITGRLEGALMVTVEDDIELTFRDVSITSTNSAFDSAALYIHSVTADSNTMTVDLEGSNTFVSAGGSGIRTYGVDLNLQGNGYWRAMGLESDIANPISNNLSFTLPAYRGTVHAGETFKEWSVEEIEWSVDEMKSSSVLSNLLPGETVNTTAWKVNIDPVFADAPNVPATGDGANPVLWCALAAIGAAGMVLMRRKKEA